MTTKKRITTFVIVGVLLLLIFEILNHPGNVIDSVKYGLMLWSNNVFTSLFPFIFISELLIAHGFVSLLEEIFAPVMARCFGISGSGSFVIIMSMISGFPSGAKYTSELLNKNLITIEEANKLIIFTHFSNPIFILGTLAVTFLGNITVGYLILIIHFITNFIIGFAIRSWHKTEFNKNGISIKKAFHKMLEYRAHDSRSLGEIINDAITSTLNILILILGAILLFLVIVNIIDYNINLNMHNKTWITGLLELTQGLKHLSLTGISLKMKTVLAAFFLSFGGFSIHLQVISIISKYQIKYFPFLIGRLFHAGIASILTFIFFDFYV